MDGTLGLLVGIAGTGAPGIGGALGIDGAPGIDGALDFGIDGTAVVENEGTCVAGIGGAPDCKLLPDTCFNFGIPPAKISPNWGPDGIGGALERPAVDKELWGMAGLAALPLLLLPPIIGALLSLVTAFFNLEPFLISLKRASRPPITGLGGCEGAPVIMGGGGGGGAGGPAIFCISVLFLMQYQYGLIVLIGSTIVTFGCYLLTIHEIELVIPSGVPLLMGKPNPYIPFIVTLHIVDTESVIIDTKHNVRARISNLQMASHY